MKNKKETEEGKSLQLLDDFSLFHFLIHFSTSSTKTPFCAEALPPAKFHSLCCLLVDFFEGQGPPKCVFGLSGALCEKARNFGPPPF